MVAIGAYAWHEWVTGTSTETLLGADLNFNFDYVSAMVNKGITGANIAMGGIDSGALIASGIIGEAALDRTKPTGVRLLQIGKNTSTITGQMVVKGTFLVTATNTTNTDVTVAFSNGDCCTAGDPAFAAVPMVWANAYTYTTDGFYAVNVKACTAGGCTVNVDAPGALTFTENVTIYWCAVGNK